MFDHNPSCSLPMQAHIGAILLSKFTSYQDFHTQLYTCAAEFDYLPLEYPLKLSATMLLPTSLAVAGIVVTTIVNKVLLKRSVQNKITVLIIVNLETFV